MNFEDLMRNVNKDKAKGSDYTKLFENNPFMENLNEVFGGRFDFNSTPQPDCDVCSQWQNVFPDCPKCRKKYIK